MKSFRIKLLVYFFVLVLASLAIQFWNYDTTVNQDILSESSTRAKDDLLLAMWLLREHPGFLEAEELDSWITELGGKMGVRITFIQDGRVIADSDVPFERVASMEDHGSRPEVVEALSQPVGMRIRFSSTVEKDLIYVAAVMDHMPGMGEGVLRLASPFSIVKTRIENLRKSMAVSLLLTLAAIVLSAFFISRNLTTSIQRLSRTAQAIGRGDYGKRIRFYPGEEFKPLADAINNMASGIERHISTIEEQRGQLLAVFNGMDEGVMVLNAQGRIIHFNPSLEEMFPGLTDKVGRKPLEAIMEPAIQKASDEILRSEESISLTIPISLSDGRWIEVNLEPYFTDEGYRQLALVFHDITVTKQAEQMQKDFVANVSHELRTPLTSIKGYAETLMAGDKLDKKMADKFLGIIVKNADHMSQMVNDLLRLARNTHANKDREPEEVDMADMAASVIRDLAPAAERKNVVLDNRLDPEAGITVMADPQHLSEVLRNLIENAVYYGPEGGKVWIEGDVREKMFECRVHDQGQGLPVKDLERVFERFYRGGTRKDSNDKDGHAGLGLAICKQLVTGMGGKVWAENDSEGAVFHFTLPLSTAG